MAQSITVRSSDSLLGLGRQWAQTYTARHPEVNIQVDGGSVVAAFTALQQQKAGLVAVSRLMRYQEIEACEHTLGRRPAEFKVGVNGLAVYVNALNPVQVLTYDELAAVFTGKRVNWKDLGGQNAPITLYGQQTNSATGELFVEEVLDGKGPAPSLRVLDGPALLKAIAADRNGIGFGPLASAQGVRALGIKRAFSSTPVEPSDQTISDRLYPISRYLYAYLDPAANQGALKAYVDWIRSEEGQHLAKAAGFFPLPPKSRSGP